MKKSIASKIYVLLIMIYLYVPIIVLMIMGFNKSRYNSMPFEFSTEWYRALATDSVLQRAALNSVILALVTGVICVVLGTFFILGERYLSDRLKGIFNSVSMMPMSIPWLIMGLSLLLLIRFFNFDKSMFFVAAGHVVISLPYSLLVLKARVQSMDTSLEEMSASLGAGPFTTFRRITFPAIAPAMVAGGFLSFMISFDNFAISYFLMPAGVSTLPIEIQSSIKFGFTPEINAVSTVIIGVSLLCLAVVGLIMGSSLKSMVGRSGK
ncbi:ABC transporter permease [Lachnospiraceae bacterium NSJ-143]|nr:ABC transporter permease [Lachnospiraceae bacterium NSJ-143]